jgi:hypothetical protein
MAIPALSMNSCGTGVRMAAFYQAGFGVAVRTIIIPKIIVVVVEKVCLALLYA